MHLSAVLLAGLAVPGLPPMGPENNFTVLVQVQGTGSTSSLPAVLTNKAANGGKLRDDTTSSRSGMGRTTDDDPGWSIHLRPDGAWGVNLSDGDRAINYRPWGGRQGVLDGEPHEVGFVVDRQRDELRLHFDGEHRATISIESLGQLGTELGLGTGQDTLGRRPDDHPVDLRIQSEITAGARTAAEIHDAWIEATNPELVAYGVEDFDGEVSIMAWNIWHGGRHNGRHEGPRQVVEVIRRSGADVVCMQETYGSGPLIADMLDWYFVGRSSNCSVLSRFPITRILNHWSGFHLAGAELKLPDGRPLRAFSLWIHYLPDVGVPEWLAKPVETMLEEEQATRGGQIESIIEALATLIGQCDEVPMVVAGDYNSLSHLDWTAANSRPGVRPVPWQVSTAMYSAGFTDAFRAVHPDALAVPSRTWSPRFPKQWQDRIDYVYTCGNLIARQATMIDTPVVDGAPFPSDHAAIMAVLHVEPPCLPPPP